jgi:hypothetical protein
LAREKVLLARQQLSVGLAGAVERLEPTEVARLCAEAARSCNQALDQGPEPYAFPFALERVSVLLQPLDGESAARAARALASRIVFDPDNSSIANGIDGLTPWFAPEVLERVLTNRARPRVQQRADAEPLPCRLSTQDLVELLKMPTCVAEVRRVVLDQLGNRYCRQFETHWDFVRYAQENGLKLDFTTPPQRPDRKLPPLFAE